ncbi:hypothetical protein UT300009_30610 [Paraclostridium bifermentans]
MTKVVKINKEVELQLTDSEVKKSVLDAIEKGIKIINDDACMAHMANNFESIFNDKFYMKENNKTDRIPVFNLPNIMVQSKFLRLLNENPQLMDLVPENEKESFEDFVVYLKNNPMCVNCETCSGQCYNNKAYVQYPAKAICDLRQLYRVFKKPHIVAGEIVQSTINSKNARLNGSGEIHNEFILDFYKRVCKMNPDTTYYTYTKNYKLFEGKKLPKNLVVNLSKFGTDKQINESIEYLPKNLNTFVAVTKEEMAEIKKDKEKSKRICLGESCSSCRLCTKKKGIEIYCEIH